MSSLAALLVYWGVEVGVAQLGNLISDVACHLGVFVGCLCLVGHILYWCLEVIIQLVSPVLLSVSGCG